MDDVLPTPPKDIRELRSLYACMRPNGHFFDHDTMKFFGERLSEMRLLKRPARIIDISCTERRCYVVSSVQRPGPPLTRRRVYHYFDVNTLEDVIPY